MDTTILFKPEESSLFEMPQDGPETTMLKERSDLFSQTQDKIQLTVSNMSEREFLKHFKENALLAGVAAE